MASVYFTGNSPIKNSLLENEDEMYHTDAWSTQSLTTPELFAGLSERFLCDIFAIDILNAIFTFKTQLFFLRLISDKALAQ